MFNKAYNKAIKLLSIREHSIFELKNKLIDFEEDVLTSVLNKVKKQNYQCDKRFAEMLIRSRMAKGKGKRWLKQEFMKHQIDSVIVSKLLDSICEEEWHNLCEKVWNKKYSKPSKDFLEQQKQKRFLFSRGFSSDDWTPFL